MIFILNENMNEITDKNINFKHQFLIASLFGLMQANRKLWEEKMSIGNFFKCHLNAL